MPFFASEDGIPQVFEGGFGHVRVADDVVWRANEFTRTVTADFDEGAVGVGDDTGGIGARDEDGAVVLRVAFIHGVDGAALTVVILHFVAGGFAARLGHVGKALHRSFLLTVCRVDGLPSGCGLFIL